MKSDSYKRITKNRAGMILFFVLGGIFILSIVIVSYNQLVRGKFNESQELIKHLYAMKYAQASVRYTFSKMITELSSDGSSRLREAFRNNNPNDSLLDGINTWIYSSGAKELVRNLSEGGRASIEPDTPELDVEIEILSRVPEEAALFFDFEIKGYITLEATVRIGKSTEVWKEKRPFRVILPFPTPMTKFNLYLTDARKGEDKWKFNLVSIEDNGSISSPVKPLVLNNGEVGTREDIWKDRGWIYLGGGEIMLNRAGGYYKPNSESDNYGQGFHSYFLDARRPIILEHLFTPTVDDLQLDSDNVGFSIARWGFSKSMSDEGANMWKKILANEFSNNSPDSSPNRWKSSFLQLFGRYNSNGNEDDDEISHTRIIGNVYDRFLEIGYMIDTTNKNALCAIVSLDESKYNDLKEDSEGLFPSKVTDDFLYFPEDSSPGYDDDVLLAFQKKFFTEMNGYSAGSGESSIHYRTIMSKAAYHLYSDTYDLIAQYIDDDVDKKIDIPPTDAVDSSAVTKFITGMFDDNGYDGLAESGLAIAQLKIDDLVGEDKTLGLKRRACYEINMKEREIGAEGLLDVLMANFCEDGTARLKLGNSVLSIVSNGEHITLPSDIDRGSGGAIISDGSITVGTFIEPAANDGLALNPLLILSENGDITIDNTGNNPTLAYLVALGSNGEIKYLNPDRKADIIGGIAANTLNPNNIRGGGTLTYNPSLEPANFSEHIGVVIGPAGGQ